MKALMAFWEAAGIVRESTTILDFIRVEAETQTMPFTNVITTSAWEGSPINMVGILRKNMT